MNKRKLLYGSLLTTLLLTASCNSFLEENPDNRVDLDNVVKAAQLLTNAYASGSYTFTEWMSDNVSYTTGTFILPEHNEAYQWQDVTSIAQDTPTNFWAHNSGRVCLRQIDQPTNQRDPHVSS